MTDSPANPAASDVPAAGAAAAASAEPSIPPLSVPDTTKAAERAALNIQKKLSTQALPVRQYLESTVVPLLMQGMQALCKERPDNPVEYLANFLLQHNPQPPSAAGGSAAAQQS